jgi:3-deoxy-D-manno-octulosonic-acid transferase
VGETVAAEPLVHALLERYPHVPLLVTSTTPTGAARVRDLFGDRVAHCFLPFDLPFAVAQFLKRTRPRAGIIMETEIWPNLFHACRGHAIPLILANARLSDRSARGYQRAGRIIRDSLAAVHHVAAQGEADAAHFHALGLPSDQVTVTGNLKFEAKLGTSVVQAARALRTGLGPAPIWMAASTHEGEERIVLQAFKDVRRVAPALRLLIVPRHPERFATVGRMAEEAGWQVSRRSHGWDNAQHADVLLGDSMGELGLFYTLADIAFVGGSLVHAGGHNIIEAAVCCCPIIVGPHTFNMAAVRTAFERAEALISVTDEASLARATTELTHNADKRKILSAHAQALLSNHRGAKEKLLAIIERTLR